MPSVLVWRKVVLFFETAVEVGRVSKTALIADFTDVQIRVLQQGPGIFQPFPVQPFPGGFFEIHPEVAFKGGKAPATEPGVFLKLQVEMEVFGHHLH